MGTRELIDSKVIKAIKSSNMSTLNCFEFTELAESHTIADIYISIILFLFKGINNFYLEIVVVFCYQL